MNWTKNELVAYILLYAANSDFSESNDERNIIISKVDMNQFQRIHKEFENDNDYQSIQKIINGIEAHNYSKDDISELMVDLKAMFFADGEFDTQEQSMFLLLKKILTR